MSAAEKLLTRYKQYFLAPRRRGHVQRREPSGGSSTGTGRHKNKKTLHAATAANKQDPASAAPSRQIMATAGMLRLQAA